jgi:hypothetical protein
MFEMYLGNQRNGEELLVIDILKQQFVESRSVAIIKNRIENTALES